jgi:hypothetical protein
VATFADYWHAGFTGVIPVIPPDAPLSAACKIKPEDRGKVPGRLNGQGTWGGFDWLHHQTREAVLDGDGRSFEEIAAGREAPAAA